MKQPLTPKATMTIFVVVIVALIIAGFAYFKPQIGPGPAEVPKPYKKPGSAGYGSGSGAGIPGEAHGFGGGPGVPQGAPGSPGAPMGTP